MASQPTSIFIGAGPGGAQPQALELKRANRHGLIAGATGTGKTVTLQGIVEGLSAAGVPTFVADVKGDLAGLAMPGSPTAKTARGLRRPRRRDRLCRLALSTPARCNSGTCSASRATRSAPRSAKWGRCCSPGC